jgi:phospholipase/carboxylesterase
MNGRLAIPSLLLLCSVFVAPARAAEATRSTASIAGFESLILITGGASPEDALPMIIGLHYSNARPETIAGEFDAIDVPARIVLPRGNHPRRDGYSWFADGYAQLPAAEQTKPTFAALREISALIDEAMSRFPTIGKPAITGISYGGDLSYLVAIHHPDKISAAFPVAARFPAEWMPDANGCAAACPTILVMHGAVDAIVPIEGARDAARRLQERGFRVELREYPEIGHDFPAAMKSDFTKKVREVFDGGAGPALERR